MATDKELEEQRQILSEFRSLVESKAWARLVAVAEAQLNIRVQAVMFKPLKAEAEAFEQEYMKGEYNGISTLLKLPETMLEEAKQRLAEADAAGEGDDK